MPDSACKSHLAFAAIDSAGLDESKTAWSPAIRWTKTFTSVYHPKNSPKSARRSRSSVARSRQLQAGSFFLMRGRPSLTKTFIANWIDMGKQEGIRRDAYSPHPYEFAMCLRW